MGKKKKQYYLVVRGHKPGIYRSWFGDDGAEQQIKAYPDALFKGFYTEEQAFAWLRELGEETVAAHAPTLLPYLKETASGKKSTLDEKALNAGKVVIYTDGSAMDNPGAGGYAAVIRKGDRQKEIARGFARTTNNRMELMACIAALQHLEQKSQVLIFSDSKYIVDAIEEKHAYRWRANRWMRSTREKVANVDLWKKLLTLCDEHDVDFHWVRGHAGNPFNERCDFLAKQAATSSNLRMDHGYSDSDEQPNLF
jgi:ribonuclease HI